MFKSNILVSFALPFFYISCPPVSLLFVDYDRSRSIFGSCNRRFLAWPWYSNQAYQSHVINRLMAIWRRGSFLWVLVKIDVISMSTRDRIFRSLRRRIDMKFRCRRSTSNRPPISHWVLPNPGFCVYKTYTYNFHKTSSMQYITLQRVSGMHKQTDGRCEIQTYLTTAGGRMKRAWSCGTERGG